MEKIFDVVPGWIYAIVVGILLVFSSITYIRLENTKTSFLQYQAQVAVNTQKAEVAARAREQNLQNKVDEVSRNADKRELDLKARIASSNSSLNSLRNAIADATSRAAQNPGPSPFVNATSIEGQLLNQCATRYRQLAEDADGLKDQVAGLQDYVQAIVK